MARVAYLCVRNIPAMEIAVADNTNKNAANSQFRKLRQAEDGKRAMLDYENNAAANRAKTTRLRALRLARDAEEAAAAAAAPPPVKKKAAKKKLPAAD
jgi:hypothetical protein